MRVVASPKKKNRPAVVYLGLGSNLGHSENLIDSALSFLSESPGFQIKQRAPLYRSKPLDDKNQPDYINTVACLVCECDVWGLLDKLQLTENHFGRRRRDVARWASRMLDLDILLFDDLQLNHPRLIIPHAGMLQRDFVLYPLFDIAPKIEIPGFGPLSKALHACENRGLEKLNEYD